MDGVCPVPRHSTGPVFALCCCEDSPAEIAAQNKYITRHKCSPEEFAAVKNGPDKLWEKGSTSTGRWGDLPGVVLQAMIMQWVLLRAGSEPNIPNTTPRLSACTPCSFFLAPGILPGA